MFQQPVRLSDPAGIRRWLLWLFPAGNSLAGGGLLWTPALTVSWQCQPGQLGNQGCVSLCFLSPGALPRHHRSLWDGWGTCALPRAWVQILLCRSMASPPGTSRSAFGNAARANRPIAMWTCRTELVTQNSQTQKNTLTYIDLHPKLKGRYWSCEMVSFNMFQYWSIWNPNLTPSLLITIKKSSAG